MLAGELTGCGDTVRSICWMRHSLDFAEAQAPMRRRADAAWRSDCAAVCHTPMGSPATCTCASAELYLKRFMAAHASWLPRPAGGPCGALRLVTWKASPTSDRLSLGGAYSAQVNPPSSGNVSQRKSQPLLAGDAEATPRRGLRRPGWSMECGLVAAWEW